MSGDLYSRRPVSDEALAAARELARLSEDTRWRDLGNGTIEVVTMTNGPVERWLVLEDGTATLLHREPKTRADKWSLRVGCGGCLTVLVVAVVLSATVDDPVWTGAAIVGGLLVLALAEQLARHSWGDVERYLERLEGGSEGWTEL